jgi:hypothetical protein
MLSSKLDGILESNLPLAEKRRLWARTATSDAVKPASSSNALDGMEGLLLSAGRTLGLDAKVSITRLKDELRQRGCIKLASRASKVSRARNTIAHPDISLESEIVAVLSCEAPVPPRNPSHHVSPWHSWAEASANGEGSSTSDGETSEPSTTSGVPCFDMAASDAQFGQRLDALSERVRVLEGVGIQGSQAAAPVQAGALSEALVAASLRLDTEVGGLHCDDHTPEWTSGFDYDKIVRDVIAKIDNADAETRIADLSIAIDELTANNTRRDKSLKSEIAEMQAHSLRASEDRQRVSMNLSSVQIRIADMSNMIEYLTDKVDHDIVEFVYNAETHIKEVEVALGWRQSEARASKEGKGSSALQSRGFCSHCGTFECGC